MYVLVVIIVILLVVFSISITFLLWKIKILKTHLLSRTESLIPLSTVTGIPSPLEVPSGTVTYEEISERSDVILEANVSYVQCTTSASQNNDNDTQNAPYETIDLH